MINQIVNIYLSNKYENNNKLSKQEAIKYFSYLINKKHIVYVEKDNKLIAWMEFWTLTEEQCQRVIKDINDEFCPLKENIEDGNIYFIADIFINEEHRGSKKIIFKLWRAAEKIHGKRKVIIFEERKRNRRFRVFQGGG